MTKQAMLAFLAASEAERNEALVVARGVAEQLYKLDVTLGPGGVAELVLEQFEPSAFISAFREPNASISATPTMANRGVMPINTSTERVGVGEIWEIEVKPRAYAIRPERIFVSASDVGNRADVAGFEVKAGGVFSAANWLLNDIIIDGKSQLAQSGALPGDMFSNVAIDSFVAFETIPIGGTLRIVVTYQGPTREGTPFYGAVIGTCVGDRATDEEIAKYDADHVATFRKIGRWDVKSAPAPAEPAELA